MNEREAIKNKASMGYVKDKLSNFKHVMNYVVQAYNSGMGWVDTRYGAQELELAKAVEAGMRQNPNIWINGKPSATRIVKSSKNRIGCS